MSSEEIIAVLRGPKPETMREVIAWETALAELVDSVTFIKEDDDE